MFVGDTHAGSNTGLCKPGFILGGADKKKQRPYSYTVYQERLYKAFGKALTTVKAAAKGYRLFVMLGGDLVDGTIHHDTTETQGTEADQKAMAIELLNPWASAASVVYGVTGTEAHVGHEGQADRNIYDELCGENYATVQNLVMDGKRLWWAHHGIGVGKWEWTRENPAITIAKNIEEQCMREGKPRPDLVMAHDRHRTFKPPTVRGVTVAVCPCWQLADGYYSETISPFSGVDLGVMTWIPSRNELTYVKAEY